MTDKEIIKALEYCSKQDTCDEKCPFRYVNDGKQCYPTLLGNALDLINRQQAEIKRLRKEQRQFADIGKMYSEVRAEAVNEFA